MTPAQLKSEQVTAITDTREQEPLDLDPLQTVTGTLATGDYSVEGTNTNRKKYCPTASGSKVTKRVRLPPTRSNGSGRIWPKQPTT